MPLYKINTDEIQKFLKRRDINFAEVSRQTGISKMTFSNLRTGRTDLNHIRFDTIITIQKYIEHLKSK